MTLTVERAAGTPADVHTRLARHLLADGLDFVLDIERSPGSCLVDARTGSATSTCSRSSPRPRWA